MALLVWLPLRGDLSNQGLSSVTITTNGSNASYSDGKIGLGLNCNGSTYWTILGITLGDEASICCWTKTSTNGKMSWVLNASVYSSLNLYEASIYTLNTGDSNKNPFRDTSGNNINALHDNNWHHFVVTFGNNTSKLYIDGEYRGSAITFKSPATPTNSFIKLGGGFVNAHTYDWNGMLNDFRVYDHCLSPKEVKEISKGLVLHYKLDNNCLGEYSNSLLPNGVELYDYIEGDGTSKIDTGFVMNGEKTTTFKIDCYWHSDGGRGLIFGNFAGTKAVDAEVNVDGKLKLYNYPNPSSGYVFNAFSYETRHYITMNSNSSRFWGNMSSATTNNLSMFDDPVTQLLSTSSYKMFNDYRPTEFTRKVRIYSCSVLEDSILIHNYVPCTYFGEPGMWDTVTNLFFGNSGTGEFTLGNKITLERYDYLQNDGEAYINTGIGGYMNHKYELMYKFMDTTDGHSLIWGTRGQSSYMGKNMSMTYGNTGVSVLYWNSQSDGGHRVDLGAITTNNHTLTVDNGVITYDGVNKGTCAGHNNSFYIQKSIYLFAVNNNSSAVLHGYAKIYKYKDYDSFGNLVRHMTPCKYNGECGLWDKVEYKFYGNASASGEFSVGLTAPIIVQDVSGYNRHGNTVSPLEFISDSPRYLYCIKNIENYPLNAVFDFPESKGLTMSCWIKLSKWGYLDSGLWATSTNSITTPADYLGTTCNHRDSCFDMKGTDGTVYRLQCNATNVPVNTWKHVAFTHDGTDAKLYINGSLIRTLSVPTSLVGFKSIFLGWSLAGGVTRKCLGSWSDFRIYVTALSATQIKELYDTSAFVHNDGTLECYEFDEVTDGTSVNKNGCINAVEFTEDGDITKIDESGEITAKQLIEM